MGISGVLDFLDKAFEPIFKFALDASTSLEESEIERLQSHVAQWWWNVARGDLQRESLYDRRLAHARFADQNRVVLPAPGKHIDNLPNLKIAPEHRIKLAGARIHCEIDSVLVQIRVLRFWTEPHR